MKLNFLSFPKCQKADLHHHFSGSIYAEPILEDAIVEDFTQYYHHGVLKINLLLEHGRNSAIANRVNWVYKQKIMEKWSIKTIIM
jgi:adenosine deaminase/adenosine deaminase CECR1